MADFLASNIIWIIVGAVVLIMAIIGYFAENSELGKKVLGPRLNTKQETKKIRSTSCRRDSTRRTCGIKCSSRKPSQLRYYDYFST